MTRLAVAEYTDALAAGQPAPGGGSACALAAALGAALAAMVARLTIGRARHAAVQEEMAAVLSRAESLRSRLLELVDEDATAYRRVSEARAAPAATPAERESREAATAAALEAATAAPLAVAEGCVEVLELSAVVARSGNRNAAGDAAVAALLASAALEGSIRNARINLARAGDPEFRRACEARLAALQVASREAFAGALGAAAAGG